jgi:hypothetical protein
MPIDFSDLSTFSSFRQPRSIIDASFDEKTSREALLETMQPLAIFDPSVTTFDACSALVNTYGRDEESSRDIEAFERERIRYLKDVVAYARLWFHAEENPEQKLFELSKMNLRDIDPSLIGESRYNESDRLIVKVYKTVMCFFLGQLYMWCFTETIRRHDILKWGASQDPRGLECPPIPSLLLSVHERKDPRDVIVDHVCIHQLGFTEEERENLHALFRLFPGEIKKFDFFPKTKKFSLVFKEGWELTLDWQKIREQFPNTREQPSFKGIQVDLKEASIRIGNVVEGKVVQEGDRTYLEFGAEVMRATIPATFQGAHLDFYVDILQWGRREDGSMTVKIDVSTNSNWFVDKAVKAIVVGISTAALGQATHAPILPPEGRSISILNSEKLELIKNFLFCKKI